MAKAVRLDQSVYSGRQQRAGAGNTKERGWGVEEKRIEVSMGGDEVFEVER